MRMSRTVVCASGAAFAAAVAVSAIACGSFGSADDAPDGSASSEGGASDAVATTDGDADAGTDAAKARVSNVTTEIGEPFYLTIAGNDLFVGREAAGGGVYRVDKT